MSVDAIHSTSPRLRRRWWQAAQVVGVGLTLVLLTGLIVQPRFSLNLLWNVVIPLLPASFLICPSLWRAACPLATVNMLSNGFARRPAMHPRLASVAQAGSIVLLYGMVPARRFFFNVDGPVLAVTVLAVIALAVVLGGLFGAKAGFCNSLCPVLPVERLYGQRPWARVVNPRCTSCTKCVPNGCLDLAAHQSFRSALESQGSAMRWLSTPYGLFAASFPGFVLGYFHTADGPLATAASVYATVGLWALGSLVATVIAVRLLSLSSRVATLALAVAAFSAYYWYAAPVLAASFSAPIFVITLLRTAAIGGALVWLAGSLSRRRVKTL